MKTKLLISAAGLLLLASCAKTDLYEGGNEVPEEKSLSNAENVFGVKFSADQDWCTTVSGQVTVKVDASVKNVILMAKTVEAFEDPEDPTVTTRTAFKTINQAEPQGRTDITLYYDAPEANDGLFVAFVTNDGGYNLTKVENGVAEMNNTRTRAEGEEEIFVLDYTLPNPANFHVEGSTPSFASLEAQGWNKDEVLYYLNDYTNLKMTGIKEKDYTNEFKDFFKLHLDTYLPNGRQNDNSWRVSNTEEYNNSVYVESVKDRPIILTPVYKHDQAKRYGNEVFNSDLYYYYYKPEEVTGNFVDFIKALPKYKVIPFNEVFGETEDAKAKKHGSYALPFFKTGDSRVVADAETECTFFWPAGYKIGFMIQAKTTHDDGLKQGEIYGDGRLNNNINNWGNFASSHLGDPLENYPRILWNSYNNRVFMSWESGTDNDFNDVVIEMEGGKVITRIPDPDLEWFTYCFEDTEQGDYDMNDLVIKATRINETKVQYMIVACGAYDDIYVKNLTCGNIKENVEVHELFGEMNHKTFINTDGSDYDFVSGTKTVSKSFSLMNFDTAPYLYDATTDVTVKLAGAGEGPHGVLIPCNFRYPTEKTRISNAYPLFLKWAVDGDSEAEMWYTSPIKSRVR